MSKKSKREKAPQIKDVALLLRILETRPEKVKNSFLYESLLLFAFLLHPSGLPTSQLLRTAATVGVWALLSIILRLGNRKWFSSTY